ncbi:MAG: transporter [Chitinophagales bacterium]|nr:transporter [Chitinophagales bacterium]
MKNLILIFVGIISFHTVFAQDLITDRPDQTESAIALPKGYFQIESGSMIEMSGNFISFDINSTLLRYGVAKNFELRMVSTLNVFKIQSLEGSTWSIANLEAGFKYQFIDRAVKFACMGHLIFPSQSRIIGDPSWGVTHRLSLSHNITDKIGIGYNLGHDYIEEVHSLTYTVAAGFSLTEKLSFFSEVYGEFFDFDIWVLNYDNGITYLIKPNIQLDFSFGTGITDPFNFYSAGFSWRLPD